MRFTHYSGLFYDEFAPESAWIREAGRIELPPLEGVSVLVLRGEFRSHPEARGLECARPGLTVTLDGIAVGHQGALGTGFWEMRVPLPPSDGVKRPVLALRLTGVGLTNTLAWLGRVTGLGALQRFRQQHKNRQLRLLSIQSGEGEVIYDFSSRQAPFSRAFARRHLRLGLNIAGFLTADLGVGESARCMVRAADAAGIAAALVPLKLHCRNRLGDDTYAARLQEANPYPVNVFHIDPPASRDIDHHHGLGFRAGKYNIAYFAWELPDFPDAWLPSLDYYDEVWCPSDFTREAIAMQSPLPVITMPHTISFSRPTGSLASLRARFSLPPERFLFLTLFDFNSYAIRKNPQAVVAAFRAARLDPASAGLVIKVQNAAANPADFAALREALADLPGAIVIAETLSRADIYALEAACDCFVSLHRSEGFGLAIGESMFLGKPVISTDWSAPAEFVTAANGCPVRWSPMTLTRSYGPYGQGSTWAEPDPLHAAEWMRRLVDDRDLAARLGAAARVTMESRFSPAVIGGRYRRRLEAIATF